MVENMANRERLSSMADAPSKMVPPFKDYLNNYCNYQYLQQLENSEIMQSRHTQITQQYSSSTDEGCDTDHGGRKIILPNIEILLSTFMLFRNGWDSNNCDRIHNSSTKLLHKFQFIKRRRHKLSIEEFKSKSLMWVIAQQLFNIRKSRPELIGLQWFSE